MYDKALRRAGAYLHAAVWVASVLLAVVEMALARFVPHALWIALIADLLLISPLLLGRQTWYLSVSRPAEHTQEFCPPDHRALRWSVFACLRAAYTRQWGCAVAWRWGWWWRSTAVVAVSLSPALAALCLSFLAGGSGLLAAGVRLSLQVGAVVAALVGCVVALWWVVGYYPAVYLVASGEAVGASFSAARRMMRGREGRWVMLLLGGVWRFALGWIPVCGWYVLPRLYETMATMAAIRLTKRKKS